nr:KilA-N domain-containing protein [Sneathia sanguinegens]
MSRVKKDMIEAKGFAIQIYTEDFKNDYISLTDIAKYKSDEPFIVINNWLRSKDNIQFLGLWESMHNPDFKPIEFDRFRNEASSNAFTLSPQKWISPEFKLYIIQDYKRLKSDENSKLSLGWNLNREISKINYKIHTDAIKEYFLLS